jgi:hypothetical protein
VTPNPQPPTLHWWLSSGRDSHPRPHYLRHAATWENAKPHDVSDFSIGREPIARSDDPSVVVENRDRSDRSADCASAGATDRGCHHSPGNVSGCGNGQSVLLLFGDTSAPNAALQFGAVSFWSLMLKFFVLPSAFSILRSV